MTQAYLSLKKKRSRLLMNLKASHARKCFKFCTEKARNSQWYQVDNKKDSDCTLIHTQRECLSGMWSS